jgi:CshA-type fibril repeat protein
MTPDTPLTGGDHNVTSTQTDPAGNVSPVSNSVEVNDGTEELKIGLIKTGKFMDENGDGFVNVGETIKYEFTVKNLSNVPLSGITITDDNAEMNGASIILEANAIDSTTFTAVHTITQDDVDEGKVTNQASITATSPNGAKISVLSDNDDLLENDPTVTIWNTENPSSTDDNISVDSGQNAVIDVIENDSKGTFPIDGTSVSLTPPTDVSVTNIVTDDEGDVIGFTVTGEGTWAVNPSTGVVSFAPKEGFTGDPAPVDYTVKDTKGTSTTATTIRLNYPPVAVDDRKTGIIGEPVTVIVVNNDNKTNEEFVLDTILIHNDNGKSESSKIVGIQAKIVGITNTFKTLEVDGEGVWTVNDNGSITFTPENGFEEDPTPILYSIEDTRGDRTNLAEVVIDYKERNTPTPTPTPTVTPTPGVTGINATDNLNVPSCKATVIDVLGNGDRFGSSGACGNIDFTKPFYGTVTVDKKGTPDNVLDDVVVYTANTDYKGTDIFEYGITNCAGQRDTATVSVDVNCDAACDSGTSSSNGSIFGSLGMIMTMMLTVMVSLLYIRKEEQ